MTPRNTNKRYKECGVGSAVVLLGHVAECICASVPQSVFTLLQSQLCLLWSILIYGKSLSLKVNVNFIFQHRPK